MKEGALDFLAKPVDPDHLLLMVERALSQRRLATENILLREELAARRGAPQIVGEDPGLKQVTVALHRAAATDATVLLEGESGTGKELFARALHVLSPRADGPFVAINCAAIPENLLETELFGHEKGAFTGATARKPGKFELAHRGTLFLDEIGDMPLPLQAKILRALEEKRFERVGGTASLQVDVRVVAATNRNLKAAVAARQYREDLYFRLSVFPITIPPLRDRPDDIPMLAKHFIEQVLPRPEQEAAAAGALGARRAGGVLVAGQRARTAELHRACGHPHRGRHHPRASPEPARSSTRRRRRPSPWDQIDLSGTMAEASQRVTAEVERRKLEQALKEAGGQPGPCRRPAADRLQAARARSCASTASTLLPEPDPFERRLHLLFRHIVHDRRGADGRRQHEVQPAGDHLLVVAHRLEDLGGCRCRRSAAAGPGWR